jgi:DNA processing protein
MTEVEALIALNQLPVTGPVKIRRLLESFGTAESVLKQSSSSLQRVQGIGPEAAKLINEWQDHTDPAAEVALARERNIQILTQKDEDYPAGCLRCSRGSLRLGRPSGKGPPFRWHRRLTQTHSLRS